MNIIILFNWYLCFYLNNNSLYCLFILFLFVFIFYYIFYYIDSYYNVFFLYNKKVFIYLFIYLLIYYEYLFIYFLFIYLLFFGEKIKIKKKKDEFRRRRIELLYFMVSVNSSLDEMV